MKKKSKPSKKIAAAVREKIEKESDRLWRMDDFSEHPPLSVAKTLSRLTKAGVIQRISKGVYYSPRKTTFGQSRPNPASFHQLANKQNTVHPSGMSAANLLGFCTQTPSRGEVSTTANSLPRKLIGDKTIVHSRRPTAWAKLSEKEAALLNFMRDGGKHSELSDDETIKRLLNLIRKEKMFSKLVKVAATEPPRVRALLGAIGETIKADSKLIDSLKKSLNPLSRFDFSCFSALPNARKWQAK